SYVSVYPDRTSVLRSDLVDAAQIKIEGGVGTIGCIRVEGYRNTPVLLVEVAGCRIRNGLTMFAVAGRSTGGHVQYAFGHLWVEFQLTGQSGFASFTFQQEVFRRRGNRQLRWVAPAIVQFLTFRR